MANDIIGGPEPIIIQGHVFQFCPLNDLEFSALDSWVSWRAEKKISALSEEGLQHLLTEAGAVQLLYQSTHRVSRKEVADLGDFIFETSAPYDVHEAWYKLNFIDVDFPEADITDKTAKPREKTKLDQVYIYLSNLYGWTPQQICLLTPYQQLAYLRNTTTQSKKLIFNTVAEYQQWCLDNNKPCPTMTPR